MNNTVSLLLLLAVLAPLAALANPFPPIILRPAESDLTQCPAEEQNPIRDWLLTQSTHYCYGDAWESVDLGEYSYDQFNRLLQYTVKTWNDGAWLMVRVEDYFYNPEGWLAETIRQNFDGYEWQKSSKACYEYDAAGRKTLMALYDFYNNNWVEWSRHVYSYNAAGLLATENTYNYDDQGMTIHTNLKTYSYNAEEQLTELFERSITGDWEWVFDSRTLYTYDQDGLLTQALFQEPDGNYIWQDLYRNLYFYDANGLLIEDTFQSRYDTTDWQNLYRSLFSYDANGLLSEKHCQEYEGGWLSSNRSLYTRDDYGNDTGILVQWWMNSSWNDTDRWDRVFSSTSVEDDLAPVINFNLACHPNPFIHTAAISFELKISTQAELSVFNLRGQKLCDLSRETYGSGKYIISWDGKDQSGNPVPPGVYLIRLRAAGQGMALKKLSKY